MTEKAATTKTLTIAQPWATLVAIGAKQIETRSWKTNYRGDIAIHAGKGLVASGGRSGEQGMSQHQSIFAAALGMTTTIILIRGNPTHGCGSSVSKW